MVRGVMHVRASGRHDYYVEPLFRLDGGHLERYYDRFYYHVSEGATIADVVGSATYRDECSRWPPSSRNSGST